MKEKVVRVIFNTIAISLIPLLLPAVIHAEIVVFDSVALFKKPLMLKVLTKGRFFPEGGRLVDFFIDGNYIGRTLSGGDGYALFEYIPKASGLKTVMVKSDNEKAEGRILITGKNEGVILLEIEGGTMDSLFSGKLKEGSIEAIKRIMTKYRVVYLTTLFGLNPSRKWLEEENLPPSVVLRWTGADLIDELMRVGIKVAAIVGSPPLISEASEYIKELYSFNDTEDGTVIKDWKELSNKLRVN